MKPTPKPPIKFQSHGKGKKKRRFSAMMYVVFWLVLTVFFGCAIMMQYMDYRGLVREEAALLRLIQAEAERTVELERDMDFFYSDAFVEKVAREELGLVRSDEILFISDARR